MHTVYPVGYEGSRVHKWVVQYVGPEKATNLCWFKRFTEACAFASYLNGGECPDADIIANREMA